MQKLIQPEYCPVGLGRVAEVLPAVHAGFAEVDVIVDEEFADRDGDNDRGSARQQQKRRYRRDRMKGGMLHPRQLPIISLGLDLARRLQQEIAREVFDLEQNKYSKNK